MEEIPNEHNEDYERVKKTIIKYLIIIHTLRRMYSIFQIISLRYSLSNDEVANWKMSNVRYFTGNLQICEKFHPTLPPSSDCYLL